MVATSSSYLPAPMLSPLAANYHKEVASIAATFNRLTPGAVTAEFFESLADGAALLEKRSNEI